MGYRLRVMGQKKTHFSVCLDGDDVAHIRHNRRFGNDLEQHDTGFLIEDAAAVRPPEGSQRVRDQFLIVGRGHGERDQFGKVVLLDVRAERGRVGIDVQNFIHKSYKTTLKSYENKMLPLSRAAASQYLQLHEKTSTGCH